MKRSSFWDIMQCNPFNANRCFGGIFRFHLHDRRIRQARNQHEADSKQSSATCSDDWLPADCTALYLRRWTSSTKIVNFVVSGQSFSSSETVHLPGWTILQQNLFLWRRYISMLQQNNYSAYGNDRSGQENRINDRGDPLRWPRNTLYPTKLALTSPTSGGRSVGIVHLRTKGHGV
jgi:hypothetical protein